MPHIVKISVSGHKIRVVLYTAFPGEFLGVACDAMQIIRRTAIDMTTV